VVNPTRRKQVIGALDKYIPPARLIKLEKLLTAGDLSAAQENVVPSEMYLLAQDQLAGDRESTMAGDIRRLGAQSPDLFSARAISRTFGTPKPTLANSYQPELLNLRTFPTLMGYSSRILAESWESNLLFYAALADEIHAAPAQLNVLVPVWTQQTVERIFATHLEDWPALLRSLRIGVPLPGSQAFGSKGAGRRPVPWRASIQPGYSGASALTSSSFCMSPASSFRVTAARF
jgi:hypothetical protein